MSSLQPQEKHRHEAGSESDRQQELVWHAVQPFTKEDFMEDYYPLYKCPKALFPSATLPASEIPVKLFYGLIVPTDLIVSYADKNQIYRTGTTQLASTSGWNIAMTEITNRLGRKHHRLLTCCTTLMKYGSRAGIIGLFSNRTAPWYFYTPHDDEELLQTIKKELGLRRQVEGVWFHPSADYDYQELFPLPDLKKVQAKRAKRLQKLAATRERTVKQKGSSDTLRA